MECSSLRLAIFLVIFGHAVVHGHTTAAILVGGYWERNASSEILSNVEIFGCPRAEQDSVTLNSLPHEIYLPAGIKILGENKIMICGGYTCSVSCGSSKRCFEWTPESNEWTEGPSMKASKFNFILVQAPNLNKSSIEVAPLTLGYDTSTEILDLENQEWLEYLEAPSSVWYSLGCLIQYNGGKIYSLREDVLVLDPETWNSEVIDDIPVPLIRSGKCSGLTLGDHPGIFLRYGYWYDLVAKNWTQKAPPPVVPVEGLVNSMWSFRGRPTLFGHPVCNNEGACENKQVVQYNPDKDKWEVLGEILHSRIYHEVIEVPEEFCEILGISQSITTTSTTTSTTSTTTTSTSTAIRADTTSTNNQDWKISVSMFTMAFSTAIVNLLG